MKASLSCIPLVDEMPLECVGEQVFEMGCEYPKWRIRVSVIVCMETDDVMVSIKASWRKKRGRRFLVVTSDDAEIAVREMWEQLRATRGESSCKPPDSSQ